MNTQFTFKDGKMNLKQQSGDVDGVLLGTIAIVFLIFFEFMLHAKSVTQHKCVTDLANKGGYSAKEIEILCK
jgi:hypothetical protein